MLQTYFFVWLQTSGVDNMYIISECSTSFNLLVRYYPQPNWHLFWGGWPSILMAWIFHKGSIWVGRRWLRCALEIQPRQAPNLQPSQARPVLRRRLESWELKSAGGDFFTGLGGFRVANRIQKKKEIRVKPVGPGLWDGRGVYCCGWPCSKSWVISEFFEVWRWLLATNRKLSGRTSQLFKSPPTP